MVLKVQIYKKKMIFLESLKWNSIFKEISTNLIVLELVSNIECY